MGLFFLGWFLITLAPILPLRDHITDYYLAIPVLGLATVLALGLDLATRPKDRAILAIPLALYLFVQIPAARFSSQWNMERSHEVRTLVLGILRAHELHPGKSILITRITPYLYAFGMAHSPFHVAGFEHVYLTPETNFSTYNDLEPPTAFTLPPGPTLNALEWQKVEVYDPTNGRIRNVTASYTRWALKNISDLVPSTVDVGNPLMAYLLGSTWYPLEDSLRWMPKVATVRIAAPQKSSQKLYITGYCPQDQTSLGPLTVHISIDGKDVSGFDFRKPEVPFTRIVDVPSELTGKSEMEVGISVSRTFQGGSDSRPLGVAFGTFEVR